MANPKSAPAQRLTLVTLGVIALVVLGIVLYARLAPRAAAGAAGGELTFEGRPMLGDPEAPVEIAVFEDFKCPACAYFDEDILPRVERELIQTGQARMYFIHYPFLGPDSTTAAIASECAYRQDEAAFWDFKTYIFRSQGDETQEWATPARLADIARNNVPALDADELRACTEEERYADVIRADRELGNRAGVRGTPTVLVNGVALDSFSFEAIQAAVQNAQSN
jgi:protein-disulfide isomerase